MCGRIALTLPNDAMAQLFGAQAANDLLPVPRYNICPTQPVPAIIARDGTRHMGQMRWGFLPSWYDNPSGGPLLINARAETIAQKPAFAQAARVRRCLIPVSGFFEWTQGQGGARLPWYIAPRDRGILALAGIWQVWERGDTRHVTCAVVTCAANATMARLHDRMPVIIAPQDWPLWLGEGGHGAARLMRAAPDDVLAVHRVSPRVNSNRAEGADLIEPFGTDA